MTQKIAIAPVFREMKVQFAIAAQQERDAERERGHMGVEAGRLIADVKLKHLKNLQSCLPPNPHSNSESMARLSDGGMRMTAPMTSADTATAIPTSTAINSAGGDTTRFKFLRRRYRRYTDADVSRRLKEK